MKIFEIKHRFTGKVIFKLECKSLRVCLIAAVKAKADLRRAGLRRAGLRGADLGGAYLGGADLRGAYLGGADLRGAYLGGADLRGAYLGGADGEKIKIEKTPLQILGLRWDIIVFDNHMKIGCEFNAIKEWENFNDEYINNMDCNALLFWKKSKDFLISFCHSNGRK